MFDTLLDSVFWVAVLCFGGCCSLAVIASKAALPNLEPDDRSFMDPLSPGLKLIWPLIMLASVFVEMVFSNRHLDETETKLQKTGVSYLLKAEQFIALRFVSAVFFLVGGLVIIAALKPQSGVFLILLLSIGAGYMLPMVWLSDTRKRREKLVTRELPVFLDFTTMAVEAGLNLSGALQQAVNKGPSGPLRNEFTIVMRDLRSGVTRADALRRMADRLHMDDITSFVNAMVQAEKMGSSMAATLRIQSEQRRMERFQRAEKKAMEAPVKLIFPLIVFIFPVTFMVLGFPIAMKFLDM